MLLVYDIVRTLLGKVLVFAVLVALVFGAALAVRYVAGEGRGLLEGLAEADRLAQERAQLQVERDAQAAELASAEAERDALISELDEDAAERTAQERGRLQGLVTAARGPAEEAHGAWRRAVLEAEGRAEAWVKQQVDAVCAEGVRGWLACKLGDVADIEARFRGQGRQRVLDQTAAVRGRWEEARDALDAAETTMNDGLETLRRDLDAETAEALAPLIERVTGASTGVRDAESRIAAVDAERAALVTPEHTRLLTLLEAWRELRRWVLTVVLLVLLAPYVKRIVWYWLLLPIAERAEPIQLVESPTGAAEVVEVSPSITVRVSEHRPLLIRPTFVTSHEGQEGHRWMYDWRYPFVSYAAGLVLLNRYTPGTAPDGKVLVADPLDGHPELMLLRLEAHSGVVLHPRHLVGVQGDVRVRSVWRIASVHSWATLQFRYLLFEGTGALILSGGGHVTGQELEGGDLRTLQSRVLGFDARLGYATRRTGSFVQYLLGRAELIEDRHLGDGLVLTQTALPAQANRSPVERALDAIFGALGKVLGF